MNLVALIDFIRKHLKGAVIVCLVLMALLVIGDGVWVDKEHAHTKAEHVFGFWALYGFLSCLAIIFISKWFGHLGIMKREDYYGDE